MSVPSRYELELGLRYLRAKTPQQLHLVHFADFHCSGIALGVAALIIVISVMNGF